jgi:signal transduction histidine kinase
MADFTELAAIANANAESHAELVASRARLVAAFDRARRNIERDLHDGVQQRLVSLALTPRGAQERVPDGLPELNAALAQAADGLVDVRSASSADAANLPAAAATYRLPDRTIGGSGR